MRNVLIPHEVPLCLAVFLAAACSPSGPTAPRCPGPVEATECALPAGPPVCGNGVLEPEEACDPGGIGPCGPDCRFTAYGCVEQPEGPVAVVCNDEPSFLEHATELERHTFDDRPAGFLENREYLAPWIRIYVADFFLEIAPYVDAPNAISPPNALAQAYGPIIGDVYAYLNGPFYFEMAAPVRAFAAHATATDVIEYWVYDGAPPDGPPSEGFVAGGMSTRLSSDEAWFFGLVLRCDARSFVIMEPDAPSPCCGVGIDDVILACPRDGA